MEKLAVVRETHNKAITALCYNPMKHEIVLGCEGICDTYLLLLNASATKYSECFSKRISYQHVW